MVSVRRLTGKDTQKYHALCQVARKRPGFVHEAPHEGLPERWLDDLAAGRDHFVLGAFDSRGELVGLASVCRMTQHRFRHRASLHQVYAAGDLEEVLKSLLVVAIAVAESLQGLRQLELEVIRGDSQLLGVAGREGFEHYGDLPDAVELNGSFYDQHFLVLHLVRARVAGKP